MPSQFDNALFEPRRDLLGEFLQNKAASDRAHGENLQNLGRFLQQDRQFTKRLTHESKMSDLRNQNAAESDNRKYHNQYHLLEKRAEHDRQRSGAGNPKDYYKKIEGFFKRTVDKPASDSSGKVTYTFASEHLRRDGPDLIANATKHWKGLAAAGYDPDEAVTIAGNRALAENLSQFDIRTLEDLKAGRTEQRGSLKSGYGIIYKEDGTAELGYDSPFAVIKDPATDQYSLVDNPEQKDSSHQYSVLRGAALGDGAQAEGFGAFLNPKDRSYTLPVLNNLKLSDGRRVVDVWGQMLEGISIREGSEAPAQRSGKSNRQRLEDAINKP